MKRFVEFENDDSNLSMRERLAFDDMADIPRTLWHYTTPEAFLSILSGKTLRLTDYRYLNDSRELVHFVEHLQRNANVYLASGDLTDDCKHWLPRAGKPNERWMRDPDPLFKDAFLGSVDTAFAALKQQHLFVACFCEHDDLLSQWRGYTDNATGVAIGLDLTKLVDLAESESLTLRKCRYVSDEVSSADYCVTKFIKETRESREEHSNFAVRTALTALTVKSPYFENESEWRLISGLVDPADSNVDYRSSRYGLTPFLALQFAGCAAELITDVKIGPGPMQANSAQSVISMRRRHGYAYEVSMSAASHRG